jgi:AraC-like DNA-binding protein
MRVNNAAAFSEWLLDPAVVGRVLDGYLRRCGSVDALLDELGIGTGGGCEPDAVVRRLAPADLARVSGRAIGLLAAQIRREAGKPLLRAVDWRLIRYTLHGGRTVREALERCVDCFEAIDGRCGRMTLSPEGERAVVRLDAQRDQRDGDGIACLIDLHGIARVHALLCALIVQPMPLSGIALAHDPAFFTTLGLPPLPLPVEPGAEWTGFFFPSAYLDHPVERSVEEDATGGVFSHLLETPDGEEPAHMLSIRVRRIAMRALRESGRLPSFELIVATVGGSTATVRRRLAAAGMNYREIKDSCRRELALKLLAQPHGSIEEFATRLDFCDSDAFRRSFRTWFGASPSAFRARLASHGGSATRQIG